MGAAIVTGAGSPEGIGFAVARHLHAAGMHVAIASTTDRIHERARELDPKGERVSAFVADLTDETAVGELVDKEKETARLKKEIADLFAYLETEPAK